MGFAINGSFWKKSFWQTIKEGNVNRTFGELQRKIINKKRKRVWIPQEHGLGIRKSWVRIPLYFTQSHVVLFEWNAKINRVDKNGWEREKEWERKRKRERLTGNPKVVHFPSSIKPSSVEKPALKELIFKKITILCFLIFKKHKSVIFLTLPDV